MYHLIKESKLLLKRLSSRTRKKKMFMSKRHSPAKKLEIAKKLIEYRKKHNMTQEELARVVNGSVFSVSRWERAKHYPTSSALKLMKIAGVL